MALSLAITGCGSDAISDASTTLKSEFTTAAPVVVPSTAATIVATSMTSSTAPAGAPTGAQATVTITVLYDNTATYPGTRADWGFSCLVEGLAKTVLFDTGNDGDILLSNMEILQIDPEDIDVVVLSHDHDDHIGGLAQIVAANPDVTVYYPASFSAEALHSAQAAGASLAPVENAVSVCPGLTVTGPSGSPGESGLLIDTAQGWVLVVGCAHPGVLEMTASASQSVGEPVFAVMGGFHLMSDSAQRVDQVIQGLRELGVERCGPAHCTGEAAIAHIDAAFAGEAIEMGVGAAISY